MPSIGNAFLKLLQTILYAVLFCCTGLILGIYSFFLSVLADRNIPIATWKKAVEGLSGAAVVYLILAVVLTCFLGGIRIFAFIAIALDILFAGAMIAVAVLTRDGTGSCTGTVDTPLGSGPVNQNSAGYGQNGFGFDQGENSTYAPNLGFACRLNKVAFAVSIIAAVLFLICAGLQLGIARKHQKDKRYGPSPSNDYTSGSGPKRHFWQKKSKAAPMDHENGYAETKYSHDTGYTGTGTGTNTAYTGNGTTTTTNVTTTTAPTATYDTSHSSTGGFHTAPQGSYAAPGSAYSSPYDRSTNY